MDHYSTLGLEKNASQEEIKKAFRKLASQHHPDKGGDTKRFQEIQAAYDTLSDPEKKAQYDNPRPQFEQFNGMPPGFEDFFQQFGAFGPFGDMFGRQRQQRNKNLSIQTSITLEEVISGKNLTISLMLPSGKEQICDIKIPKGIQEGTTLRIPGMGDNSFPNLPRGDLHLTVHILPHAQFQRQGDDILKILKVNAIDAITGIVTKIETIDKKLIEINIPTSTQHGTTFSIPGYGIPNMNDNRFVGRLLIRVEIEIPKYITEQQLNILQNYKQ